VSKLSCPNCGNADGHRIRWAARMRKVLRENHRKLLRGEPRERYYHWWLCMDCKHVWNPRPGRRALTK